MTILTQNISKHIRGYCLSRRRLLAAFLHGLPVNIRRWRCEWIAILLFGHFVSNYSVLIIRFGYWFLPAVIPQDSRLPVTFSEAYAYFGETNQLFAGGNIGLYPTKPNPWCDYWLNHSLEIGVFLQIRSRKHIFAKCCGFTKSLQKSFWYHHQKQTDGYQSLILPSDT